MSRSETDTDEPRVAAPQVTDEETAAAPSAETPQSIIGRSPWEIFWRHFRQDRFALVGIFVIAIMALMAIFAPVIASWTGHGPNQVNLQTLDQYGLPSAPNWWPDTTDPSTGERIMQAPSGYLLGVDDTGRDLFVRIVYGARTSLIVAFFATGIALVIGVLLGLTAGFYRGKIDTLISRTTDVVLALPILLLALRDASAG
jgi:peptide/nickel transport system permease protein